MQDFRYFGIFCKLSNLQKGSTYIDSDFFDPKFTEIKIILFINSLKIPEVFINQLSPFIATRVDFSTCDFVTNKSLLSFCFVYQGGSSLLKSKR